MSPRAPAMAPDDRRAAIIAATVPLLRARGRAASTREIATAAGIAEGTIFRVFENKGELMGADAEQLRVTAHMFIGYLRMLTLSSVHPMLGGEASTPEELVDVLLEGALARGPGTATPPAAHPRATTC